MKSGKSEKLISKTSLSSIIASLLLILFILNCALVPELDSYRVDRIAEGPEFTPYFGLKRRIAVLDFENFSSQGGAKLGSLVADQLVSKLARSDRFILVERSRIEKILQEQALGQSGAITEETAPRVGQLLGVESLILGKIHEASQETGRRKIDNEKKKWSLALKATVGNVRVSYRMVNTTTGEILLADDLFSTEIKPGFDLKTKDLNLENMFDLDQTVIGIAIRKAVNKMAQDIVQNVGTIEWVGKVVQSKADTLIYFTPGRGAGVKLKQGFDIFESMEFQDEEMLIDEEAIRNVAKARVIVTGFIGDKVARARVLQGGRINRGDIVKLVTHVSRDEIE